MNCRRFLQGLFYGAATALLVKAVLKWLSSLFAPRGCSHHFVHTWDGGTRRTWIDGKEVFSGGAAIDDIGTGVLGEWGTTYMLPTDAVHTARSV